MIDNIKVFLYLIYPHYKDELSLSTSEKIAPKIQITDNANVISEIFFITPAKVAIFLCRFILASIANFALHPKN